MSSTTSLCYMSSEDTTALIDIVFIDDQSGECNRYDGRIRPYPPTARLLSVTCPLRTPLL